eukprot:TRINITY_DN4365_c4_g1_i1.p1 TRINITY_DN4365_c4_g1~~TRINITY_DN4365_c4_g1_i1.p1  ORF type:complete len:389 (+),score=110.71 TRINITY_DN4365_c4_g1_i1:62-1228(+)
MERGTSWKGASGLQESARRFSCRSFRSGSDHLFADADSASFDRLREYCADAVQLLSGMCEEMWPSSGVASGIQTSLSTATELVNSLKHSYEMHVREVAQRAQELAAGQKRRQELADAILAVQQEASERHISVRELESQVTELAAENGQLKQRLVRAEAENEGSLAARAALAEMECKLQQCELRCHREVACREEAERALRKTAEDVRVTDSEAQRLRRLHSDCESELQLLRDMVCRIDAAVERVRLSFPFPRCPRNFHRTNGAPSRWRFGGRTLTLHLSGDDVFVGVGGGYLRLNEYVARFGEAEAQREGGDGGQDVAAGSGPAAAAHLRNAESPDAAPHPAAPPQPCNSSNPRKQRSASQRADGRWPSSARPLGRRRGSAVTPPRVFQ